MTDYIALTTSDLALGGVLILVDAGLSLLLGLGLARPILVAGLRMVVQLTLMGLVLNGLFAQASPLLTLVAALVMIGFAGYEITARQDQSLQGVWRWGIGTGAISLSTILVTVLALFTALRPDPWYDPHYAIPLLGMILGNTMTGIALGLNVLTSGAVAGRVGIEAQLMLGATRFQALSPMVRKSLRTALLPIINTMAATGVVSLPGMMTGQILGGVPPVEAVKYQIMILSLVAGAIGIGAIAAIVVAAHRLTDSRHRLRLDRLVK